MNKLSILAALTIAILFIPVISAFADPSYSFPKEPHNADAMWVEPGAGFTFNTASISVGYKFNVTVCLNITSSNIFFWQCALLYNRTWLECLRAGLTAGTTSAFMAGHTTTSSSAIDGGLIGNGSVLYSEGCLGADFITAPQVATLFWAEFRIVIAPNKGETETGTFDISTKYPTRTWAHAPGNTNIPLTFPANPTITYQWQPPNALPYMGIEHDLGFGNSSPPYLPNAVGSDTWPLVWSAYPPVTGMNAAGAGFTALIYVKNIDPAWYMQNVQFTLTWNSSVIDVLGGLGNVSIDANWAFVTDAIASGSFSFNGNFTGSVPSLGTKVPVANLTFTVLTQGKIPPKPSGYTDESDLKFTYQYFTDHTLIITPGTPELGHVTINALVTLNLPYLYLSPATQTVGPTPSIGSIVCVYVKVANLTTNWHVVAIQTRVSYDDSVLSLVGITFGPFMANPIWNLHGVFNYSLNLIGGDMVYPYTHVMLFQLLLPNGTGKYDQTVYPNTLESAGVDNTFVKLCFQVLQQNCFGGLNITTNLNLLPFWPPTDKTFIDNTASYVADQPGLNATVTIQGLNFVGRIIDLYGGAVNDGYGVLVGSPYLQFPAPYGGQGPNHYMDIVFPQSWIYLHANVTYNYWGVQKKDVGFEIEGPFLKDAQGNLVPAPDYQILAKFTATTDANGVASYAFRMPWPCDQDLTGVWKITSTVTLADQVVSDTMTFYYQHQVYITGVSTDAYGYYHDGYVKVTVKYSTHSVETYPALFSVVITDDLGVPIGMALYSTMVGGATFCTWKNGTFTVSIFIPKWAYAGNGYVHVSVYDKDPTVGGEAIGPEFTPAPQINIYPYNTALSASMDLTDAITLNATKAENLTINGVAAGGYPLIMPGDIPTYWYDWYVNGVWKAETLSTTGAFVFHSALFAPGTYTVHLVVTDTSGNTATADGPAFPYVITVIS